MTEIPTPARARLMLWVCVLTSFVGAAAGFAVQPMIARQLLPSLGGTAAVWNTTVLFFQLVLLIGYSFSHVTATRVPARKQGFAQLALVALGIGLLPLRLRLFSDDTETGSTSVWIIITLALSVGLPYLALTTTSPFVQYAFARSGHSRAHDPYFLYAASNVGSLFGLVAYPFILEANLGLASQRRIWSVAYLVFAALVALLVVLDRANAKTTGPLETQPNVTDQNDPATLDSKVPENGKPSSAPTRRTWLTWIGLAVIPAAVSLGATSHLTTDVAPVPLIWVLCLSLYLISFIVAFGRRSVAVAWRNAFAGFAVGAAIVTTFVDVESVLLNAATHLATVFAVGLAFHGRLADLRPDPAHLTQFYVALSIGGILGTLFNAIVAPLMFNRQIEYPIALVVAALCVPRCNLLARARDAAKGAIDANKRVGPARASLTLILSCLVVYVTVEAIRRYEVQPKVLLVGVGAVLAALMIARESTVAAAVVLAFAAMSFRDATQGSILFRRSFYGAIRVDDIDGVRQLVHGTTTHGYQFLDPTKRRIATAYYARSGPLGRVIDSVPRLSTPNRSFGVVGLGTGTVATYLGPTDAVTYFEIDQEVVDVATDKRMFTYLSDQSGDVDIVLGDGRKSLETTEKTFDLLVLDAFSSDAIPTHLLTVESVSMYRKRLRAGGVLAVHISNRYLDLEPVVGAIASTLRLHSVTGKYSPTEEQERTEVATASDWVFLSESSTALDAIRSLADFGPTRTESGVRAWTDDRIDITKVLIF